MIMIAAEFVLIPNTTPFHQSVHPGTVDYDNPIVCITIPQHTEQRCEHNMLLHVFEMEQMIEVQMKKHIMFCFDKDVYIQLKEPRIGYTNVTVANLIAHLYQEYGEKMEELQNKALADLDTEVYITGQSMIPFRLRQEKLKLFLKDTEQRIEDGMYVKKCLGVIERTNYINKAVLSWRAQPLLQRTVALF